jgi:hypothetical protein
MDLPVAIAIVAGAYLVMLVALYGARRLLLAGRIGPTEAVTLLLTPMFVGLLIGAFFFGDIWMSVAVGMLALVAFWIALRLMRPFMKDLVVLAPELRSDRTTPSAGLPRASLILVALTGIPGFVTLLIIVLILLRDHSGK